MAGLAPFDLFRSLELHYPHGLVGGEEKHIAISVNRMRIMQSVTNKREANQ